MTAAQFSAYTVVDGALTHSDAERLSDIFSAHQVRSQLYALRPSIPLCDAVDQWISVINPMTRVGTLRLENGQIGGCLRLDGDELSYFVAPEFWRQGIAKVLFGWMEAEVLPALNYPCICANTVRENTASVALLEASGFVFDGFSKDDWPKVNALRYVRRL